MAKFEVVSKKRAISNSNLLRIQKQERKLPARGNFGKHEDRAYRVKGKKVDCGKSLNLLGRVTPQEVLVRIPENCVLRESDPSNQNTAECSNSSSDAESVEVSLH